MPQLYTNLGISYQEAVFNEAELEFLVELSLRLLAQSDDMSLRLSNIAAITPDGRIYIKLSIKKHIEFTDYARRYGMHAVNNLFANIYARDLRLGQDSGAIPDVNITMLTCLSLTTVPKGTQTLFMPGMTYHRDGGGSPYTTSITLASPRTWTGGALTLTHYNLILVGKPVMTAPHISITVETGAQVHFDNRRTLHAVDSRFCSRKSALRIIFQARTNNTDQLPRKLLWDFSPAISLLYQPSILSLLITQFLHPQPRRLGSAPLETFSREKRATYEVPEDSKLRDQLVAIIGSRFNYCLQQLRRDGVLILPSYFWHQATELQRFYHKIFSGKDTDPFLAQASVNGAINPEAAITTEVLSVFVDPTLLTLITAYFGEPIRIANWRAYELGPRAPIDYRAWGSFHNDQKGREIKIMILINGVNEGEQAMRVYKGTHRMNWIQHRQRDTKCSTLEALALSPTRQLTSCHGPEMTVIIFDTNMSHSGIRIAYNQLTAAVARARSVITINYVSNHSDAPIFRPKAVLPSMDCAYSNFILTGNPGACYESRNLVIQFVLAWVVDIKSRLAKTRVINTEQDYTYKQSMRIALRDQEMPGIEDVKIRLSTNNVSPRILAQIAWMDLQADMDFLLHIGSTDNERDIQLVAVRDQGSNSPIFLSFVNALNDIKGKVDYLQPLEFFIQIAKILGLLAKSGDRLLARYGIYACDLAGALSCCDTSQRFRTTLLHLIFTVMQTNAYLVQWDRPPYIASDLLETMLISYRSYVILDDILHQPRPRLNKDWVSEWSNLLISVSECSASFFQSCAASKLPTALQIIDDKARLST
ncbi:MAG: hypothetical protein A3E87_03575 [Gammaproteobacteria bacterium RIFCSPHIGHO2_12_FULL_35_23]|nr:MAG: hypothetical protein A3E87_03575 [Gammaproteobacteria bacterium RIFCSPHIGHO2_12_FULL_35_23]